jgi:hypothetical protein
MPYECFGVAYSVHGAKQHSDVECLLVGVDAVQMVTVADSCEESC